MKTLIFWILFVLFFSSCATQERCALKFPSVASHDSVYIQKLVKDTITLKGDSIKIVTQVPCDNFEIKSENSKLKFTISVLNGRLSAVSNLKPDTVEIYKINTVTKIKEVKVPEKIKFIPKFWRFTGITGICSLVLILAFVLWKLRKFIKI
jgi:hypothetical protein